MSIGAVAQKKPKEKKLKGNFVIILPIVNAMEKAGEQVQIQLLYGRAGLLKAFDERKFDIVSPVEVNATLESEKIDAKDTANWTPENLDKLATAWSAKYVAGVVLQSVATAKDPAPTGKAPQTYSVTVGLSSWLYDVKEHKFLMQDVKSTWTKQIKQPRDGAIDEKQLAYTGVEGATEVAFKDFLQRFKKSTPAENKPIS